MNLIDTSRFQKFAAISKNKFRTIDLDINILKFDKDFTSIVFKNIMSQKRRDIVQTKLQYTIIGSREQHLNFYARGKNWYDLKMLIILLDHVFFF